MLELALLLLISAFAFGVGQTLLRLFRIPFATAAGWIAAATALGLATVAHGVLVLGLAGCLNQAAVLQAGAVVMAAAIVANLAITRFGSWRMAFVPESSAAHTAGEGPEAGEPVQKWSRFFSIACCAILLIAALATLTSALAPPTAGDALCYHLEIPKRFVEQGTISYLPLTDNSLFPFHMEMLYTLGLLFGTPVLAQLMHWLIGVLFALAVVELAALCVGRRAAWWAAVVACLVPGVTNQMTAPLNDLAVALFCTLMLTAWVRWLGSESRSWLASAGLWAGFAIGTKLVAVGLVVMVVLATVAVSLRRHLGTRRGIAAACNSAALYLVVACLVGGIWYARSWYYLGNPVYPYFNGFFGLEAHTHSLLIESRNPFTLAWNATMRPEAYGGRGVQFGAVFLVTLPGLVLVTPRAPLRWLLGIAAGFAALWFAVRQDLRFLLPVISVLAVGVVGVLRGLHARRPLAFRVAAACVAGLLVLQELIVLKRARPCVAVAWGGESREEYLRRHEPTFEVAEFVNQQLPSNSRVISQDYRGLYFNADFVREASLRRRMPYREQGDELVRYLAAQHFTHVLLVESHNPEIADYDSGFPDRLGSAVDRLPLLLASHFEGPGGDRRDYRLYELPNSP
jgi:hypothetical protein